ncbi:MAG: DNA mismatch repair protein MutS [Flavobacteriaceae bacterium]|nr:MAG: DNA mismatch repair protein MutS [Flavobacteriaceae bacterium]
MNWILGITFILVLIFLIKNYYGKKRIDKLRVYFLKNWGKPKEKEYFNFYVIGSYFENNEHKNKAYHLLSEKVKIDLDINEIFKFIDRTSSKIGQQYLYFKLRTISSVEQLLKFDTLTKLFETNKILRLNCQVQLSKLNSNNSYYLEELIHGRKINKPKILWFIKLLSILSLTFLLLTFIYPIFSLFLIPIFSLNVFFHYKNKGNINYYLNGVNQLSKSLKVSKKLANSPEIKAHYNDLSFLKKIDLIKFKTEFIGFDKYAKNEYTFLLWFPIELIKIQFNLEYIIFFSFIDSIIKEKESIEKMFLFIGEIDSAISTASLKSNENLICTPKFTKNKQIISKDIYHPLINNCIPNNLNLINNSMLLTGSNMSGKTTFIRTVAVNSILAQTLNVCFAKEYSAPFFKVYTSIRVTDDLLDNTSYYLEEVLTVKELVDASKNDENCLFVLDEIFKGTNTIERISGGKAILSFLNKENHIVLVSTHDIELTDLLEKENYELHHFSENIENDELFFDHKLKTGKLKTRNAIKILELYKYPTEIITEARNTEQNNFS